MADATFTTPDLTTFCRLDDLGLEVTGQRLAPDQAVLACRVVDDDRWCRDCGCGGRVRDTVVRRLAHEPLGWRPTILAVTVRRYACTGCGRVWRQDTANDAVLAEGRRVLIDDKNRFDGVRVIGVDEHVWRHTRKGDTYVTVVIDLAPIRDKTGPSRLLAMVQGRSKAVFKTWLAERPKAWRDNVEVVAMDGLPPSTACRAVPPPASRPPRPRNSPTRSR